MKIDHRRLANWANYPTVEAEIAEPTDRSELRNYLIVNEKITPRGNGKCYGDAALGQKVVSTLSLNRVPHFDAETGEIECESGVLLADILKIVVPHGWFFNVSPGIKFITVGGAIASDVHGKNHPARGCFSNWLISFELMSADGSVLTCSRSENAPIFWQTCGGMGWTGVILSAKFRLRRLSGPLVRQVSTLATDLDAMFEAFSKNENFEYNVAWLDCVSGGKKLGRGWLFSGEHDDRPSEKPVELVYKPKFTFPFFAPNFLLNSLTIKAYNAFFFSRQQAGETLVSLESNFFPLDKIGGWNRLYGPRGFIQYQFCLPEKTAFEGFRRLLELLRGSSDLPFLSVIKRHGDRPPEAIHSFPIRGFSLALDFPRTPTIFNLVKKMDELVAAQGGKIYLTKDACSDPKLAGLDPRTFGEAKFDSLLKQRLLQK